MYCVMCVCQDADDSLVRAFGLGLLEEIYI